MAMFDDLPEWLRAYAAPIQQGFGATGDALGSLFGANAPASQFGQGRVPGGGLVPNMVNFAQSMRQAQGPPAGASPQTAMAPQFGNAPTAGALGTNQSQGAVGQYNGLPGQSFGPMVPGSPQAAGQAQTPTGPGNLEAQNLVQDPRTAILMELRKRGINPYGGNPVVNALLRRGGDIVNTNLTSLAGSADPTGALLGALGSAIDRALSGQAVFPSGGSAQSSIEALRGAQTRAGEAAQTGANPILGDRILAELLSNPTNAASILSDIQYGGQGSTFSGIGARGLTDIANLFNADQLAQGIGGAGAAAPGFLDYYIQRRGQPTAARY